MMLHWKLIAWFALVDAEFCNCRFFKFDWWPSYLGAGFFFSIDELSSHGNGGGAIEIGYDVRVGGVFAGVIKRMLRTMGYGMEKWTGNISLFIAGRGLTRGVSILIAHMSAIMGIVVAKVLSRLM